MELPKRLNFKKVKLSLEIKQDKAQERKFKDLIETYKSSNAIQAEMEKNNRDIELNKDKLRELNEKEQKIEKELPLLKNNKVYNPRQEQSIRFFEKIKLMFSRYENLWN